MPHDCVGEHPDRRLPHRVDEIYLEDRGTNYAVRKGRAIARTVGEEIRLSQTASA